MADAAAGSLRMVVGLGNPGREYQRTRHNVGFMVADELLRRGRSGEDRTRESSLVAPARLGDREVLIVRPQTYMNRSGISVAALARRSGIEPSSILLAYDDADLPVGVVRIRRGGSPAGHKGVASIVESLGTREIPRLRLGIGKDEGELSERVLSPFSRAELPVVERMIELGADAVETAVTRGLTEAMNRYNRRPTDSLL